MVCAAEEAGLPMDLALVRGTLLLLVEELAKLVVVAWQEVVESRL